MGIKNWFEDSEKRQKFQQEKGKEWFLEIITITKSERLKKTFVLQKFYV